MNTKASHHSIVSQAGKRSSNPGVGSGLDRKEESVKMFKALIILTGIFLVSCQTTQSYISSAEKTHTVNYDYASVWTNVIYVLNNQELPIITIEKESGLLVTDFVVFSPRSPFGQSVIKPSLLEMVRDGRYKLSLLVLNKGPNLTSIRINTHIEKFSTNALASNIPVWSYQQSNGFIERSLFDEIDLTMKAGVNTVARNPLHLDVGGKIKHVTPDNTTTGSTSAQPAILRTEDAAGSSEDYEVEHTHPVIKEKPIPKPPIQMTITPPPKNAEAFFLQGVEYSEAKQYNKAIWAYKAAINLDPIYAEAHYNLAVVYKKKGLNNLAQVHAEKAAEYQPGMEKAYKLLDELQQPQR